MILNEKSLIFKITQKFSYLNYLKKVITKSTIT